MPEGGIDLVPSARPALCCVPTSSTSQSRDCAMALRLGMLLGFVLLPAVRMLLHVLHSPAHYALGAGSHLQLPAGNLAGVEDRHPSHHEVPCAE